MPPAARARSWAVLLGGVAMVAIVAGAGRWLGRADVHSAAVGSAASRSLADGVRFVFVLSLVVGLGFALVGTLSGGLGGTASPGPRAGGSFVRAAVITVASLGSALLALVIMRWLFPQSQVPTNAPVPLGGSRGPVTGAGHAYPQDWPIGLATATVVLLAAVGTLVVLRSRRRAASSATAATRVRHGEPSEGASFDPDAEPDPRRAVISVYHWVLAVLDAHGRGRRDSEAPFEHVERTLGDPVDARAHGRTLAGAFEFARYSDHRVPPQLRTDAIAAAREVVALVERPTGEPDLP
jgi:hypothetical protein